MYIYILLKEFQNSNKTGKVLIVKKSERQKIIDLLTASFE